MRREAKERGSCGRAPHSPPGITLDSNGGIVWFFHVYKQRPPAGRSRIKGTPVTCATKSTTWSRNTVSKEGRRSSAGDQSDRSVSAENGGRTQALGPKPTTFPGAEGRVWWFAQIVFRKTTAVTISASLCCSCPCLVQVERKGRSCRLKYAGRA